MKLQRELGVTSIVVSHDIRSVVPHGDEGRAARTSAASVFFGTPEEMAGERRPHTSATSSAGWRFLTHETFDVHHLGPAQGRRSSSCVALRDARRRDLQARAGGQPVHEALRARRVPADANGLRVGGSVTVAGQLAGTVKEIEFLPVDADTTRNLRVDPRGRRGAAGADPRATREAQLRTLGLLGDKVLDITPGHAALTAARRRATRFAWPSRSTTRRSSRRRAARSTTWCGLTQRPARDHRRHRAGARARSGSCVTNRALYDQLNGTLARAEHDARRGCRTRTAPSAGCSTTRRSTTDLTAVIGSAGLARASR